MYRFWGKVRKHNQRGKKLGFPTANVNLNKKVPEGVYISKTKLGEVFHPSLTFVGVAKTFNEKRYLSETYVLDFDQDIYGKWISVILIKKIRGNKKFNSPEELMLQMKQDKKEAEQYFSSHF